MGPTILNPIPTYARRPSILLKHTRKLDYDNPTPLVAHGNLSIEKTWVTSHEIS